MHNEYAQAVKAHEQVFGELGENQIKLQWELDIFEFLPFRHAGQGNISHTFFKVFKKLLDNQKVYPRNITFVLVSDGDEPYDYDEISDLIEAMKKKYLIQFISIAVGGSFPNSISNHLRNNIQNQNQTCPPIFSMAQGLRPDEIVFDSFLQIFQSIKSLLTVSKENFEVNEPVYTTLQQDKPTTIVAADQPFYIYGSKDIVIKDQQIQETNNPAVVVDLVKASVQDAIIKQGAKISDQEPKEQTVLFQQISQQTNKILGQTSMISMPNQEQIQQITPIIQTVNLLAVGGLDLKKMNEKELTDFQVQLENPDQLQEMIDKKEEQFQVNDKDFSSDIVKTLLQNKINQLMLGCQLRNKKTQRVLDQIESTEQIIVEGIQNLKKLFSINDKINISQVLREIIDIVNQFLETLFEQLQIKFTQQHQVILKKINSYLQQVDSVLKSESLQKTEIIKKFDECLNKEDGEITTFSNFDENDYFFLPESVAMSILLQSYVSEKVENIQFYEKKILQQCF